jgi:ParB-like nuclease domain
MWQAASGTPSNPGNERPKALEFGIGAAPMIVLPLVPSAPTGRAVIRPLTMFALSGQHCGEPPPWASCARKVGCLFTFRRALPMPESRIETIAISALRSWKRNARTHSKKQIRQIADSIETFGFTNAVLIDAENTILAGHGRVEAAKLLRMDAVPCVRLEHMTPEQKRAWRTTSWRSMPAGTTKSWQKS